MAGDKVKCDKDKNGRQYYKVNGKFASCAEYRFAGGKCAASEDCPATVANKPKAKSAPKKKAGPKHLICGTFKTGENKGKPYFYVDGKRVKRAVYVAAGGKCKASKKATKK